MPIDVKIDSERRLVVATPRGTLTHGDLLGYQKSVWTRPDLAGFDELVDMTQVEKVDFVSPEWMGDLASLAAGMDAPGTPTRMAIVAVNELHLGLAKMYRTLRASDPRSTREVRVCPSAGEAQSWLTSPPAAAS